MQKNQLLILSVSVPAVLLLIVAGIYLLINSNTRSTATMMPGSTSSNNLIIALFLIAIAIVVSITIILYFVSSRKGKSEKRTIIDISSKDHLAEPKESLVETEKLETKEKSPRPFDVFLCYKKSSGKDYADHLKTGLEELGLHTFEDCKDIPQTVDTEEGWAMVRDRALEESKFFVLIMTPGFNLSSEVVKEIGMARKQPNKTFVFFRHRSMGRKIIVDLEDEILDIGKLEQVSFETKEELLRLAHNILLKEKAV